MAQEVIEGLREGGITGLVSLPDSMFRATHQRGARRVRLRALRVCARRRRCRGGYRDVPRWGRCSLHVMEGSGVSLSGLPARACAGAAHSTYLSWRVTPMVSARCTTTTPRRRPPRNLRQVWICHVRVTSNEGLRAVIRGAAQTALSQPAVLLRRSVRAERLRGE